MMIKIININKTAPIIPAHDSMYSAFYYHDFPWLNAYIDWILKVPVIVNDYSDLSNHKEGTRHYYHHGKGEQLG